MIPTSTEFQWGSPEIAAADQRILLAHGGGGQLTDELLREAILPRVGNTLLNQLLDSAVFTDWSTGHVALTIDSYVVQPWQFPGGDIGRLAISGTVNDLAVCGAKPIGIALSLILAEGLPRKTLNTVLDSVAATAAEAGVAVVTGDTKVVGQSHADGIYITTAGIGRANPAYRLTIERIQPGDQLLINGPIGDHGLAVMLARELPEVESAVKSDAAPLAGLVHQLLERVQGGASFLRDPTRGGVAGVVADVAAQSGRHVVLYEDSIPIEPATFHAAEMLGLDPLEVANEGKMIAIVRPDLAAAALEAMRSHPLGKRACVIGEVEEAMDGICELRTRIGGRRIIQKPYGEQLPRIC